MSRRAARSSGLSRSPEVLQRLERSRVRARERRVSARERERVIAGAVHRYLELWQAITARERERDAEVVALREKIAAVQASAGQEIMSLRAGQAEVAALIRDQGASEDEVAELLEITPKQARQLLAAARTPAEASDRPGPETPPEETAGASASDVPTAAADAPDRTN